MTRWLPYPLVSLALLVLWLLLNQSLGPGQFILGAALAVGGALALTALEPPNVRARGARDHHHVDAGHAVGRLRFRQRDSDDPRPRPHRRSFLDRDHQAALRTTIDGDIRMSATILVWALVVAQILLAVAMGCAVFRLLIGPRAQDRILGLDTLYVNAMLLLLTFGIRTGSTLYFEIALVIALLGFVATVALAKFLMRGEVIE